MGQIDRQSNPSETPGNPPAEVILRTLTQNMQSLQQTLSQELSGDIERLQGRKRQLMDDIEALESDYEALKAQISHLETHQEAVLTQQQQAQQQLWAKRLAQALATHLHARLADSLALSLTHGNGTQETNRLLASLESTLNVTLHSLQQDLNSYQSTLSQQIGRMHSMEQQGEAILEALVNRLSFQLQNQMLRSPAMAPPHTNHGGIDLPPSPSNGLREYARSSGATSAGASSEGYGPNGHSRSQGKVHRNGYAQRRGTPVSTGDSGIAAPHLALSDNRVSSSATQTPGTSDTAAATSSAKLSNLQKGLIFIVLSTLALSVHNVLVGLIGYGGEIFGRFPIAGIFPLNIPNSLMLLWLRMVVVLPLMALVAHRLYPNVWRDMRRIFRGQDRRPLLQVIASGCFLFMSQVLIYTAISEVGPGVAVTLLFMYPLITVPLAWFLFGDRPTSLRLVVMFAITMGIVFTALPRISVDLSGGTVSIWGVGTALLASAAFALFLVSMQLSFKRLHPVPVSMIQFSTIFILTSLILIVGSLFNLSPEQPSSRMGLYLGGLMLGILTLMGYLFNNYGVRLMGAAQASIVASSGPVITAILAYLITPGDKSELQFIQWIGVILVTLGVSSLSLERLARQKKGLPKQPKRVNPET